MKSHSSGDGDHNLICEVRLLHDDKDLHIEYPKTANGDWLLDYVCKEVDLLEKYYFGIRITEVDRSRTWLKLDKPLTKQIKAPSKKQGLHFRVRYYPAAPSAIHEDITRYYLFYQLRRDSYHGRLVIRPIDVPHFTALILQSELGDYEDVELQDGFLQDVEYLPKLASSMEEKILEQYRALNGLTPAQAERQFIEKAFQLESYGVDFHQAKIKDKEKEGEIVHIGVNHLGVSIFQAFRRIKLYKWSNLHKTSYSGKLLTLIVTYADLEKSSVKKLTHRFKCEDVESVWICIKDQQAFFTLDKHDEAKPSKSGGLFSRNSKFRFSGRVQSEVSFNSSRIMRSSPQISRSTCTLNRSASIRSAKRLSLNLTSDSMSHSQSFQPIRDVAPVSQHDDSGLTPQPDIFVEQDEDDSSETGSNLTSSTPSRQCVDAGPTLRHTDHYDTPKLIITKPSNSEEPEDMSPSALAYSDEDEVLISVAQAIKSAPDDNDTEDIPEEQANKQTVNGNCLYNDSESEQDEFFVPEETVSAHAAEVDTTTETIRTKTEIEKDGGTNAKEMLEVNNCGDVKPSHNIDAACARQPRANTCWRTINALLYAIVLTAVAALMSAYIVYEMDCSNQQLEQLRHHHYIQAFNISFYSPAKSKAVDMFSHIMKNYL